MLTVSQREQLDRVGYVRLPAVLDRATTGKMVDAVWRALVSRGIDRDDRTTWPEGLLSKLQSLRSSHAFDGFMTDRTAELVDEILGTGTWSRTQAWGPALITFPQPGQWSVPHRIWHFDVPGRGDPDRPSVARLFGYVADVVPRGGGTLVVEGSAELVRRMAMASPDQDAGSSSDLRKKLIRRYPWFGALCREGGDDRVRQFMVDGDEIDGVVVKVAELTGEAGDVVFMHPWTMHNFSMNAASVPRFMVTHSIYR